METEDRTIINRIFTSKKPRFLYRGFFICEGKGEFYTFIYSFYIYTEKDSSYKVGVSVGKEVSEGVGVGVSVGVSVKVGEGVSDGVGEGVSVGVDVNVGVGVGVGRFNFKRIFFSA